MNELTDSGGAVVLRDSAGQPSHVILTVEQYMALKAGKPKAEPVVPSDVVGRMINGDATPARAWREHLGLTQAEVAERMGVTQSAYAQLEGKDKLRESSRERIAVALGIVPDLLDL